MFNRANKMTALLVAAAAVVSLVPATGVNAAEAKRIEEKDGTVYSAQAYKGTFVIDGDVVKEDNDNIYFLKDGKYTELEDVDSGDTFNGISEGKYLNIDSNDYFVNLESGKVTDDNLIEDNADDAATELRKKVKKDNDGRYSKTARNQYGSEDTPDLEKAQLKGNKYDDVWYETKYDAKNAEDGIYDVYTDAKGNYIDADYNVGKIKVETTSGSGATATIKNTGKTDFVGDEDLTTTIVKTNIVKPEVIGQDSNNIYRIVTIEIKAQNAISEINGCKVTSPQFTPSNDGKTVTFKAIQKISKAQASDKIDGAKYSKSVTTYIFTNKDGDKDKDFHEKVEDGINYTVANGKIVAYSEKNHMVQTVTLSSKSANYYTDFADECDDDVQEFEVDVDGNLWRLDSGAVYKWDNDEDWTKVYKVDGGMSHFSVYNKDNMVIWSDKDDNDEIYAVIGNKEEAKEEEKPEVEVKAGWSQAADGTWTFVNADNTKATGWFQDGANWYLANAAGIMQTEWQTVNGTWFYLGSNGAMQTGWQNINGAWYYLNPVSDGTRGAMKTGWINDNGTWYFADGSGKMLANTTVGGYVLGANGAWIR